MRISLLTMLMAAKALMEDNNKARSPAVAEVYTRGMSDLVAACFPENDAALCELSDEVKELLESRP